MARVTRDSREIVMHGDVKPLNRVNICSVIVGVRLVR